MAKDGKKKERKKQPILIYLTILFVIFITVAEGQGYDPIGWLSGHLNGVLGTECDEDMQVHFIDVGQGDCVFIRSGGKTMLIDCGESSEAETVIGYLGSLKVRKLDYIVATHPHSDHMGAMAAVINSFQVGEVIMPHLSNEDIPTTVYFEKFLDACESKKLSVTEAKLGRVITLGDAEAEIIAPNSPDYSNVNNYSVGIILTHGHNDFLLTGDAEELAESEMVKNGMLHHVRVFKAAHHGSSTANTAALLDIVQPDYAVISCGEGNSYGHPHKKALKRLNKYANRIIRTDESGCIVFESDGLNLQVHTEK